MAALGEDLKCKKTQAYSDGVLRQCLRIVGHAGQHKFVLHRANSHARRTRTADGKPLNPLAMVSGTRVEPRWGSRPGRYRGRRWGTISRLEGRDAAYVAWDGSDEQLCPLSELRCEAEGTFAAAVYQCYNNVAADCWGERVPPISHFVCVMLDQMGFNGGMDASTLAAWDTLTTAAKTRIIRSVGP